LGVVSGWIVRILATFGGLSGVLELQRNRVIGASLTKINRIDELLPWNYPQD
jgi:hypothetical protein